MTTPARILDEAVEVVTHRGNSLGDCRVLHGRIAALWNAYLDHAEGDCLTARDVAQMMILLKIARSMGGAGNRDHYVDMAGYAAVAGTLARFE